MVKCVCISLLSLGSEAQGFQQISSFACRGVGCVQSSMGLFQCIIPGTCSCSNTGGNGNSILLGLLVNIILGVTSLCARNWVVKVVERVSILNPSLSCKFLRRFVLISCLGAAGTGGAGFDISGKYFSQQNVHCAGCPWQPMLELQDV